MPQPNEREEVLDAELGRLLRDRHPLWDQTNLHIDATNTIRGHPNWRVDILIESPGVQPVAIEAKFAPSRALLQAQVESRLGETSEQSGATIEAGIAVVYPEDMTSDDLDGASICYAVHQLVEDDQVIRWPEDSDDWIDGTVDDLANTIELVSLSEKLIKEGEKVLSNGVRDASTRLEGQSRGVEFGPSLAAALHQEAGEQTTRMAVAIIMNAFVFHYAIEGQEDIPLVAAGRDNANNFMKDKVLFTWKAILEVNYWPIFSIAKDVLDTIPTRCANPLLEEANTVALKLLNVGATRFHDLAARMFQTLIADRKFLATFYTLPVSASLLAELAVSRLDVDWAHADLASLRIADFACGTGTLLSATQRAIYSRLRRVGINDTEVHKTFMENILLGTDIMPSAAHLTASMLSSAHPSIGYKESLVRVMPYGTDTILSKHRKFNLDTAYIGALELCSDDFGQGIFTEPGGGTLVDIGGRQMPGREEDMNDLGSAFPVVHGSFDLVIMNPPFTRPTGHEGKKIGVPRPSFAGFDTSKTEQKLMSKRLKSMKRTKIKTAGNGNAGLASDFIDLANVKVKPGGVLALVLPFRFCFWSSME